MDYPDAEGHPDTPQVSSLKGINLNTAFNPDRRTQSNKYVWRRAREAGQTPISVKRLSKAARTPAVPADKDEMHGYVKEEMANVEAQMLQSELEGFRWLAGDEQEEACRRRAELG
ncbi:hypothetical protein L7F22_023552 [Adiantum nelumboides]|nr:hypothetical protein [Adiantum nelumboides]